MRESKWDDGMLPSRDRRAWLLDCLAELAAEVGPAPLVSWPLIEPGARFFPDDWHPNLTVSIAAPLQRALWHVGLGELGLGLHFEDDPANPLLSSAASMRLDPECAVWFAGIHGSKCWFVVDRGRLTTHAAFCAAVAQQVARAYRAARELAMERAEDEAAATDVTAVFLGLGVLAANHAHAERVAPRGAVSTARPPPSRGDLSPDTIAFVLAARWALGDPSDVETARVAALLAPEVRPSFENALAYFDDCDEAIAHQLALPPQAEWPERASVVIPSIAEEPGETSPWFTRSGLVRRYAREREGYSVAFEKDHRWAGLLVGLAAGALLSVFTVLPAGLVMSVLPITAFGVGGAMRRYHCGTYLCGARLRPDQLCPKCKALAVTSDHPWVIMAIE